MDAFFYDKMITEIPIRLLSIENDGFHLLIKIYINEKLANVLVDTGASKTIFDTNRIKHFVGNTRFDLNDKLSAGLGTNSMKSHKVILKKLTIGDLKLQNYQTVLIDLVILMSLMIRWA